jgi:hypothetical protein
VLLVINEVQWEIRCVYHINSFTTRTKLSNTTVYCTFFTAMKFYTMLSLEISLMDVREDPLNDFEQVLKSFRKHLTSATVGGVRRHHVFQELTIALSLFLVSNN